MAMEPMTAAQRNELLSLVIQWPQEVLQALTGRHGKQAVLTWMVACTDKPPSAATAHQQANVGLWN